MPPLLSFENVTKRYREPGGQTIAVLDDVSFKLDAGDSIGILGLRRSGKSTLLRIAAAIEQPDSGIVRFDGEDIGALSEAARAQLVREKIGLAPAVWHATRGQRVVDFVALPVLSNNESFHDATVIARQALERAGATSRADARVADLSPGERTRVSIARALARNPVLLLVDEPSVTPSPGERDEIHELLRSFARDPSVTMIVASEDVAAIRTARRPMTISDGKIRMRGGRSGRLIQFPEGRAGDPRST
jgi:ABC-type lipoprotein export system ATPase subunit